MDALQCPVCPLRFRFESELSQHLSLEHPKFRADDDIEEEAEIHDARRRVQNRRDDSA